MRLLKGLTALAVIGTLGWGGYWFAGSRALDTAVGQALTRLPQLTADQHSIAGFPNRFDVTLTNPRFTDGTIDWQAPFLQIFALTYRLNHVIAVFPQDQQVTIAGQSITVHADDLRASVVVSANTDLPLDRIALVGQAVDLSTQETNAQLETLRLGTRRIAPRVHEIGLAVEGVIPDPRLMEQLDPRGVWPRALRAVEANVEATLSRELDRHLADGIEPRLQEAVLTHARVAWDNGDLGIDGRIALSPNGLLNGEAVLTVTGWHALLDRLQRAGTLQAENRVGIESVLRGMISANDPDRIEAPFVVVDGEVRIGPLLLARIPALR
ncbi:MAG: DUF2125 domain-containing protein [Paracoccaceae bacterium]